VSKLQHLLKMEPIQCSETSVFTTQTPGKYPEDNLSSKYLFTYHLNLSIKCTELYCTFHLRKFGGDRTHSYFM